MTERRRLAELDRVASAGGREELGLYSLEGTRLLERALRAGAPLRAVLCGRTYAASAEPRVQDLLGALEGVELHVLEDEELRRRTQGRSFGEVLALVERPVEPELEPVLREERPGFRPTLLVVVDADDPGNVGALVRTALATGALALVAVGLTDPLHPKAVRTSMGSVFRLPVLRRHSPGALLTELRAAGVRSVAAVCEGGSSPGQLAASASPTALWVGSEAHGLPPDLPALLEERATIPMPPGVDSLSVNAAAAVLLHDLTAGPSSPAAGGHP